MQTFTIAECMCMLTGLCVPELDQTNRSVNEMLGMIAKFGGSAHHSDIAVDNAMKHCPTGMKHICKLVDKTNFEEMRDQLIVAYGATIELPIKRSERGSLFLEIRDTK